MARASCLLLLLVAAAASVSAAADGRLLQTADAATPTPGNSTASGSEDRADRSPVSSGEGGGASANAGATPPPATAGDDRSTAAASGGRGSGFGTEGIVGIVVGAIATVALVVAFVRAGSSRRKTAAREQQQQQQQQSHDLADSTMSLKSVKFVESFDSSSTDTPTAAVRKPSAARASHAAVQSGSYHNFSSSGLHRQQQQPQTADAGLDFSIEDVFTPSRVRSLSRSQHSTGGRSDSLKKHTLSPESYLKLAHSNSRTSALRQSRRSRHSRATEDAAAAASVAAASPVRPSRLRFSRSSIQSIDSTDVPMLGGGGGLHHATANLREEQQLEDDDDDRESTRDIPVLARGSEESVDSVEDEDIEISI